VQASVYKSDTPEAESAVKAAVDWFGRLDVQVNNAGNFYAGFFEEVSAEDFRAPQWKRAL